jgi:hypothetical protein
MPKPEYWGQHKNEITLNMTLVFTDGEQSTVVLLQL